MSDISGQKRPQRQRRHVFKHLSYPLKSYVANGKPRVGGRFAPVCYWKRVCEEIKKAGVVVDEI